MIKIARLINGDIICGTIINQTGRKSWGHLFFVRLVPPQDNDKMGMRFIPAIQSGNSIRGF